jgi:cell division protein FtsB
MDSQTKDVSDVSVADQEIKAQNEKLIDDIKKLSTSYYDVVNQNTILRLKVNQSETNIAKAHTTILYLAKERTRLDIENQGFKGYFHERQDLQSQNDSLMKTINALVAQNKQYKDTFGMIEPLEDQSFEEE